MDRSETFIGVSTKTTPSTSIATGATQLIGGLFQVASGTPAAKEFEGAVTSLIAAAFDAFLGNVSAGASQKTRFLIIPYGYAFYRVDVCMYKYTLASKGFTDHYESQTVAYAARGILDVKDISRAELLAYAGELLGNDKEKIKQWLKDFEELLKLAGGVVGDGSSTPSGAQPVPRAMLARVAPHDTAQLDTVYSFHGLRF